MHLAIYDLDRTITRRGTFTPFLIFAARRRAPWRLLALPLWIGAMACHKTGMIARKPLKQFGLRLFIGASIAADAVEALSADYARHTLAENVQPGALDRIETDRAAGRRLIIATAAPDFYAQAIAAALNFDDVVATLHARTPQGAVLPQIRGENCYGPHKLAMVRAWIARQPSPPRSVRFYSDHLSDAPTLDWADEPFFVNPRPASINDKRVARWRCIDFQRSPARAHDE